MTLELRHSLTVRWQPKPTARQWRGGAPGNMRSQKRSFETDRKRCGHPGFKALIAVRQTYSLMTRFIPRFLNWAMNGPGLTTSS